MKNTLQKTVPVNAQLKILYSRQNNMDVKKTSKMIAFVFHD